MAPGILAALSCEPQQHCQRRAEEDWSASEAQCSRTTSRGHEPRGVYCLYRLSNVHVSLQTPGCSGQLRVLMKDSLMALVYWFSLVRCDMQTHL